MENKEEIYIKLLDEWGNSFEEAADRISELIIEDYKENPEILNVLNILLPQIKMYKGTIRTKNYLINRLEEKVQELKKKLEENNGR